jgi:hypothetical protein
MPGITGEVDGPNGSASRICSSAAPTCVTTTAYTRQASADTRASCAYRLERHGIAPERGWDTA